MTASLKREITLGIVALVLVVTPSAVALAQPQATACALISYRGLDEVATGILASSDVPIDQRRDVVRLHTEAKLRIADTFGATRASPVIVIGSAEALRDLFPGAGSSASTIYIPYRSCVVVGPNGHDVNILAHEALHAEIHHRVGHWYRLTQIPTWFDEGLAMQVDFRERYLWPLRFGAVDSGTVKQWTSRSQFFSGDEEELTRHYAMAKEEVRLWVQELGRGDVYGFLERVRGEIRALTASPFAVNLWVSTEDASASETRRSTYEAALVPLAPFFSELHVPPPTFPLRGWATFDEQVSALLDAGPPVFSFVFGVPPMPVIDECRRRSIVTIGAATTVDEAVALEDSGVDVVVASGFEAGGHRPSFLRSPETSLTGLFSLLPQVCDAVDIPVIAAGGIADGRGVAAALALGAEGVQIGTAFLACEESNAPPAHREALLGSRAVDTILTRAFSGRLARGLRNTLADALENQSASFLPYPQQSQLVGVLRDEAIRRGRTDLISLWSGQSRPLVRHRQAKELFQDLVESTERTLNRQAQGADRCGYFA